MATCLGCPHRTKECPEEPDGALLALGAFWGGRDRDCPKELAEWRGEASALLKKKPGG
jgi:hypothetical protein